MGGKVTYAEYMVSRAWQRKRLEYWRRGKYRECYVCGDPWVDFKGKELHHRTYDRLGHEDLDDLVPVCPEHHAWITKLWMVELERPREQRLSLWDVTEYVRLTYSGPSQRIDRGQVAPVGKQPDPFDWGARPQERDRRARAALKKSKKKRGADCAMWGCGAKAVCTAKGRHWCAEHDPNSLV